MLLSAIKASPGLHIATLKIKITNKRFMGRRTAYRAAADHPAGGHLHALASPRSTLKCKLSPLKAN